jgi:hypothetical protein
MRRITNGSNSNTTADAGHAATAATAHPIYDAYLKQGKWHVVIHGRDYEINPRQLLNGPSPTGHAVVWYDGVGDYVDIFCFAPGPMY